MVAVDAQGAENGWFDSYSCEPTLFNGEFVAVREVFEGSGGYMWYITNRGLIRYDGFDAVAYSPSPGDNNSFSVFGLTCGYEINDSLLALGTHSGLVEIFNKYTGNVTHHDIFSAEERYPGPNHAIRDIVVDEAGICWIGAQFGLRSLNPFTGEIEVYKPFEDFDEWVQWNIEPNLVWKIRNSTTDPNQLYMCGYSGMYSFDIQSKEFSYIDTSEKHVNSFLIIPDRQKLYLKRWYDNEVQVMNLETGKKAMTEASVDIIHGMEFVRIDSNRAVLINGKLGFGILDLDTDSIHYSDNPDSNPWLKDVYKDQGRPPIVDRNGVLYVTGTYHMFALSLSGVPPPPLREENLKVTKVVYGDVIETAFRPGSVFRTPEGVTDIQMTWALVNPKEPDQLTYSYKLNGGQWNPTGTNHQIALNNLKHGKNTVSVRASIRGSDQSIEREIITFDISIPIWERPIIYIILLAVLSAILITILYFRQRAIQSKVKLQEYEREMSELRLKALRSQMNPHFMFNSLNSVKSYIIKAEPKVAAEYLSNFSHLIRIILQNSTESSISLKDEIETLMLYVDLEKLRFENKFEFEIIVDKSIDLEAFMLPPMILQPFVENAIWHGLMHRKTKGKLTIELNKADTNVVCTIEDNGIGRVAAAKYKEKSIRKYKSMGMGITRDRIDIINKVNSIGIQTTIEDLYDGSEAIGTRVNVIIPANSDN